MRAPLVAFLGTIAASLGSVACLEQLAVSSYTDQRDTVLTSPPATMTLASVTPAPGSTIPIRAFTGEPPGGIQMTFDIVPTEAGEYSLYVSFECKEGSDPPKTCEQGSTRQVLRSAVLQQVTVHMTRHDHNFSNIVAGHANLTLWSMVEGSRGGGVWVSPSAALDLPFGYTVTR